MKNRVIAAVGANTFGLVTSIIIQLASLPIFIHYWDLERYGIWLLLNAIPSYFTLLDFGLVQAAGTNMMISMGANNVKQANQVFHSTILFLSAMFLIIVLLILPAIYFFDMSYINTDDVYKSTLLVLILNALISHFNGLTNATLFATQRYALSTFLNNGFRLFEWLCSIGALIFIGTMFSVAITLICAKLISSLILYSISRKNNQGLHWGYTLYNAERLKQLIKPGLSFMSFSFNDAISLQGIVLVVGAVLGPSSVTIFNAYRTFSRIAVQITSILSHALWSEFGNLYGKKDFLKLKSIYFRAYKFGFLQATLLCLVLYFSSPYILEVWSQGKIEFNSILMALTLLYACLASFWHIPREFLKALNMHANLVIPMIMASLSAVILSYCFAGTALKLNGVVFSMVLAEILIIFACLHTVRAVFSKKIDA